MLRIFQVIFLVLALNVSFATENSEKAILMTRIYYYLENNQINQAIKLVNSLPSGFQKFYFAALILQKQKKYKEARRYYRGALKIAESVEDRTKIYEDLCNLSIVANDLEEAIYYGKKSKNTSCLAAALSQYPACPAAVPLMRRISMKDSACVSSYHSWKFEASLTSAYDSNVIDQSSHEEEPTDQDSFVFTPKFSAKVNSESILLTGSTSYIFHQDRSLKTNDMLVNSPSLILKSFGNYHPSYTFIWMREMDEANHINNYLQMHVLSQAYTFKTFKSESATAKFITTRSTYADAGSIPENNDSGYSFSLGLDHPLYTKFLNSKFSLAATWDNKFGKNKKDNDFKFSVSLNPLEFLTLELVPFHYTVYPESQAVFDREDWDYSANLLFKKEILGILVTSELDYEYKESNFDDYDYDKWSASLGFTYSF